MQPQLAELADDLVGEALLAVELLRDGRDLVAGEVPDQLLDRPVVVGQQEVHAAHRIDAAFKYRMFVQSCYRSGMPAPPTRPVLRQRWDRRADELVEAAAARFAAHGRRRDVDGRARSGAGHRRRRRLPLLRRQGGAAAADLPGAHRAAAPARARRAGGPRRFGRPAARAGRRVGPARCRAPRPHARLPAGAPRDRGPARSGATSARAASASRGSSTACSPSSRTIREPGSPTGGSRSSPCCGMVNHTAQWFRPRGRLSAGEVAARLRRAARRLRRQRSATSVAPALTPSFAVQE